MDNIGYDVYSFSIFDSVCVLYEIRYDVTNILDKLPVRLLMILSFDSIKKRERKDNVISKHFYAHFSSLRQQMDFFLTWLSTSFGGT